ncbi:hypothetical protein BCR36DRAFT_328498 [Piromyces finnis]|uniref:Uncharacterized protein n=1 Tax=Piromyces finnis TaxID=1754191 RepID=A0A1Y1V8L2_9FUNG|nr:hypothetical protein BCR36DRAFT_328498 [Piromyces finnis]|eukprot:ORX49351.1 hypothetical protein BCR36DRAFT_328498 [Piromyces finnis]
MKFERVSIERVASKLNKDKLNLSYELFQKTSKDILTEIDNISEKNDKEIFYTTSININDDENSIEEEEKYIPEEVFRKQYIPQSFHNPVYRTNNNAENIISALSNQTNITNTTNIPEQVTLAASLSSQNLTNTLSTQNIHEAINQSINRSADNGTPNRISVSRQNSQTIYRSSSATLLLQPINSEESSPTSTSSSDISLNSCQTKPLNKGFVKDESKNNSNCSLESNSSEASSSLSPNHENNKPFNINDDKEMNISNDNDNNSNISNSINEKEEDNENYYDTKSIDSKNTFSSSTFLNNIQQIKNNAKNKSLQIPKKDWTKKYSYFDADFTMRAMDKLYSAKFYEYVKDEKNKKCIARHLIPLIKEYKICNLVNGLLWLTYGWSIQSISKLFKYIFRDWSPDLTALALKHFIQEWPNFKNTSDKDSNNKTENVQSSTAESTIASTNDTNTNTSEIPSQVDSTINETSTNDNHVDNETTEKKNDEDLANFWNKSNIYILLASIIVEESVLCSSLFIKCFTIDWTRSSVTELIKYLDIVLEWNEDFFKEFTKEFINFLKQDLAIVTAKASKLNGLNPSMQTNVPNNTDKEDIITSDEEKAVSSSSSSSSQYEYFDSVTNISPTSSDQKSSMQVENDQFRSDNEMMVVDHEKKDNELYETGSLYEVAGHEALNDNDENYIIKTSYSNDFESCSSNSYASTSVSSINSDYRDYQGEDIINSEDEEIIRIDNEEDDDDEEDENSNNNNDKEKDDDIEEEISYHDTDYDNYHMIGEEGEEEIIEEEVEVEYIQANDNNREDFSNKNKGKNGTEEDIIDEEIPEEIVIDEDESMNEKGKKESNIDNEQLKLLYEKKLKEKEDTINKIKENKIKSQELLSKLVKLYKANLTLTHYKILLADYQLNSAAIQLNEIKKRIANSENKNQDETSYSSSSVTNENHSSENHDKMNIDPMEDIQKDKITSPPDTITENNMESNYNLDPMSVDVSSSSSTSISHRVPVSPSTSSTSVSSSFHHIRYMQRLNSDHSDNEK